MAVWLATVGTATILGVLLGAFADYLSLASLGVFKGLGGALGFVLGGRWLATVGRRWLAEEHLEPILFPVKRTERLRAHPKQPSRPAAG